MEKGSQPKPLYAKGRVYKFSVYPENNPQVIREALLKRGNWKEVMPLAFQNSQIENDEAFEDAHFVWRPVGLSSAVSLLSLTLLRVTTDWKSELRLIRFHWYHTLLFV